MVTTNGRAVPCAASQPTRVIHTAWTNVPLTFTVTVDPSMVGGSWVESRSFFPGGLGLKEAATGPISQSMRFHRRWLDSSYSVELIPDRPATATVHRF